MLEDEKFALMLQNEEFMAELRGNHEFLSTLEEDHTADADQVIKYSISDYHNLILQSSIGTNSISATELVINYFWFFIT